MHATRIALYDTCAAAVHKSSCFNWVEGKHPMSELTEYEERMSATKNVHLLGMSETEGVDVVGVGVATHAYLLVAVSRNDARVVDAA